MKLPPGRNGIEPKLELQYNNQSAENDQFFGYGWSINIPYIIRLNKLGTDQLYSASSTYFYSALSGELATTTASTTYISEVDDGSFLSYSFSDDVWVVTDKTGVRYTFGSTTDSRQDDPDDSSHIYKWMLQEIRDLNGNYVTYDYYKDAGQIYPSAITYTNHGNDNGIFEVDFAREALPATTTSYKKAFRIDTNYRVSEVDVLIAGVLAESYTLGYGNGDNGHRSLLSYILESGMAEDESTTTLPAVLFNYTQSTSTAGFTSTSTWALPAYMNQLGPPAIVDVNGDGLNDVAMYYSASPSVQHTWINTGNSGWQEDADWSLPEPSNFGGVGLVDLNGDGLVDVYRSSPSANKVYLNNGNGWSLSSSTMPTDMDGSDRAIADVNGDGLPDVIRGSSVWVNDGNGTWTTGNSAPVSLGTNGTGVADLNGDGLADFFYSATGIANNVYLNTGDGWSMTSGWSMPDTFTEYIPKVVADLNGDGLVDVARRFISGSDFANTWINNGNGTWTSNANWYFPTYLNYDGTGAADLNGDGMMDGYYANSNVPTNNLYLNKAERTDLLNTLQTPAGATTTIAYKATTQYKDEWGALLNPSLPYILSTVDAVGVEDGFGHIATSSYTYAGGTLYYNGSFDKKLAGFFKTSKERPDGTTIASYYHQGNTASTSEGEDADSVARIGRIFKKETLDATDNLYSREMVKWDDTELANGTHMVTPLNDVSYTYDGDIDHKDSAISYTYSTTTGNLLTKTEWGEVSASSDGTFSDIGTDRRTITYSYAASTTPYILAYPSRELVQDQASSTVKDTKHYYDGLSFGNVDVGNETKTEHWKSESTYASSTKTYNSYGLPTEQTDGLGNATIYTYDSHNLHVATSTNPLSQETQYYYDYSLGKPKETIDVNSREFETVYDGLDRPVTEKQPDLSNPTTLVTKKSYTYTDTPGSRKVVETNYLDGSTDFTEYTYLDGLDRIIQTRREAEDANTFSTRDFIYNDRDLLEQESLPYFSSGSSRTSATTDDSLYTIYTYDALDRKVTEATVVGITTQSYADWATTATDRVRSPKVDTHARR